MQWQGLYVCQQRQQLITYNCAKDCKSITQKWGSQQSAYIETVAHHERLYSKIKVKAAHAMRAYSIAMEGLSMANLMDAARSRRVQGLDFNAQDVMRAFKIYGPSLNMVRCGSVKTKRSKTAPPVREMTVGAGVTMEIDIIFAAGVPYLIGVATSVAEKRPRSNEVNRTFAAWIKM